MEVNVDDPSRHLFVVVKLKLLLFASFLELVASLIEDEEFFPLGVVVVVFPVPLSPLKISAHFRDDDATFVGFNAAGSLIMSGFPFVRRSAVATSAGNMAMYL